MKDVLTSLATGIGVLILAYIWLNVVIATFDDAIEPSWVRLAARIVFGIFVALMVYALGDFIRGRLRRSQEGGGDGK